jgi:hypothetical protein
VAGPMALVVAASQAAVRRSSSFMVVVGITRWSEKEDQQTRRSSLLNWDLGSSLVNNES